MCCSSLTRVSSSITFPILIVSTLLFYHGRRSIVNVHCHTLPLKYYSYHNPGAYPGPGSNQPTHGAIQIITRDTTHHPSSQTEKKHLIGVNLSLENFESCFRFLFHFLLIIAE